MKNIWERLILNFKDNFYVKFDLISSNAYSVYVLLDWICFSRPIIHVINLLFNYVIFIYLSLSFYSIAFIANPTGHPHPPPSLRSFLYIKVCSSLHLSETSPPPPPSLSCLFLGHIEEDQPPRKLNPLMRQTHLENTYFLTTPNRATLPSENENSLTSP